MPTTLNLDDDVLKMVRGYAASHSLTLGEAVSDLIRRALRPRMRTRRVNGIQVVDLPPDSPRITTRRVKEVMDELD
jgi:negative regulator of replication initiation